MWGCGFDDRDEETGETAVLKSQFMHEPVHSMMTFPNPPLGIPVSFFLRSFLVQKLMKNHNFVLFRPRNSSRIISARQLAQCSSAKVPRPWASSTSRPHPKTRVESSSLSILVPLPANILVFFRLFLRNMLPKFSVQIGDEDSGCGRPNGGHDGRRSR